MRIGTKATLFLIFVLALAGVIPVAAQEGAEDGPLPCEGENVSGVITAVDGQTVTVDTGEGLCTVTLDGEYDHPIVSLLGSYFGDVSPESLAEALEATQGCAVYDADSEEWVWADCEDEDAVEVTVTGEGEDDACTFTTEVEGEPVVVTVDDPEVCEGVGQALETLSVEWGLDEEGTLIQPGDEIAAYHEDGMGFGVLVKFYAMADESEEACADEEGLCGVTVEELVTAFQSGIGMGQLFKEYGRPSMRGVGHVRKAAAADAEADAEADGAANVGSTALKQAGKPDNAGPKPKLEKQSSKPQNAGPKPKKDQTGKPDQAGPKPKPEKQSGKPQNAGPKPKKNK